MVVEYVLVDVPLVSNGPPGPRVQMTGLRPIAFEIARTRLSVKTVRTSLLLSWERRTDITKRRAHGRRRHAKNGLDCFARPAKLGDDLLVRHRREGLNIIVVSNDYDYIRVMKDIRGATMCGRKSHCPSCTR